MQVKQADATQIASKRCRGNILPIAIIVLCCVSCLLNCSESQEKLADEFWSNCDFDINHFLLTQVSQHRAVMLADAGHGSPVYMQGVIEFLNYWLDTLEHSPSIPDGVPTKLFLILERDTASVAELKRYFSSGNLMETFGYGAFAEQFTTADLEYYSDLRRFWQRVEAHNSSTTSVTPVLLEIFGPEKYIDIDNWSIEKRDEYFFHERDEYSSAQIFDLLEKNPDWKALIFYGRAHLNKARALKQAGKKSGEGYYLAHYVDEKLGGDRGLATIYQGGRVTYLSSYCGYANPTYGVNIHRLNPDIVADQMKDEGGDGFIVRSDEWSAQRQVFWVKSESLVKLIIDGLAAGPDTTNDFHRYEFYYSLRYLTTISGQELDTLGFMSFKSGASIQSTVQKWKNWYDNTKLDVVSDLQSGAPLNQLLDHMSQSSGNLTSKYENLIAGAIGCDPYYDTTLTPAQRAQTYREQMENDRQPILIDNLVNLLWVATDSERAKALEVLKKETGQSFVEAKDWMVWYRQNYHQIWNKGLQN